MSTFADLINDVWTYLYGFGSERDKMTSLTTAMGDTTSLTLQVDDGTQIDRGFLEVDDELMAVKAVDKNAGTVTLHAWGRGANGTTAETHSIGARVTANPTFPRTRIKKTINDIVNDIYPELFSVGVDLTNVVNPAQVTYPVNANADDVISISVQTIGPSQMWAPVTRFRYDNLAAVSSFATGNSVDIYQAMPPGRPIKIIYRQPFMPFTVETQNLTDVNLTENFRDVIALGAESRLLPSLDNPRLQLNKAEDRNLAQFAQAGIASQIARQLFQTYQQRIQDERHRLLKFYPGSIVRQS